MSTMNTSLVSRFKNSKPITTLVMVFIALLWLIPTIGLLVTAFRTQDDSITTGWWTAIFDPFNQNWSLESFATVFNPENFDLSTAFFSTIGIAVPSTILPITFAAFAAYGFTFLDFKFKEGWFGVIIGLMVVPMQASIVAVLQMFVALDKFLKTIPGNEEGQFHLSGEYPAGWIVHSAFAMPLAVYILRNYMMTLPNELVEAARIDGASHFQIFWRLIVPMSVPALASFAIFQFLWVWNDYLIAFIFVGEQKPVMTYNLLRQLGQYGEGWQDVAAGSFISLIVPLIVFFALQRYFVRGLTAGAVK